MNNNLNKEHLDKLRDNLLNCSLYKLNTGHESLKFDEYINEMMNIIHQFPSDYIGFEGSFNNNIFIKLWYYYRKENNIMLDINPINEKLLKFNLEINNEEMEIYKYLESFFKQLIDNNKLMIISYVTLNEIQLNYYISLVKQIQESKFNKIIDELEVNDELLNTMNTNNIIKELNEFDINYINIGKIQNKFTITSYDTSINNNLVDISKDKITLLKIFII